jgi:hypothetical protein
MDFFFEVEVYNNPPIMTENIPDFTLYLGTLTKYKLPTISDEEDLLVKIHP